MAYYMSITDQQLLLASKSLTTYVGGAMFILGTIGNVTNIVAFCCLKLYRSLATSAFLATASFFGQIYISFSLLLPSVSNLIGYNLSSSSSAACKLDLFVQRVSIEVILTCLCFSSIDRYLMTSRSARLRSLITLARARLAIFVCIVIWLCASVPSALYTLDVTIFGLCVPSPGYATTVTYLSLVFAIFLPISVLCIFGLLTRKNLGHTHQTPLNAQVTKMILLDIVVVAVSNIPLGSFLIYGEAKSANRLFTPTETLIAVAALLISTIQSTGSFYFYLIVSPTYRVNIKNMLRMICCFWKPRLANQVAPFNTAVNVNATGMPETAC